MTPHVTRLRLRTGLDYEVLEWPADDAACDRTLLLLHGYLDSAWGWQRVVDALGGRYHVVAPSFRGHGASDWVGAGAAYYFFDYVADLQSVVAACAKARLSIVGHSMGGMAASLYTGTYPERVEKLVLLEGFSIPESQTSPRRLVESIEGRAKAVEQRHAQRRFSSLADAAARMRHHDPELDEGFSLFLAEHGCVEVEGQWIYRHDPLLAPRTPIGFELATTQRFWSNIACDTLYIEGERSPMKLSDEDRARRLGLLRSVRTHTIPGAAHMMIRHQPIDVARSVIDFLGA